MGSQVLSVGASLDQVARWKSESVSKQQAELVEVEQELKSLEAARQNLQTQLDSLRTFRDELSGKVGGSAGEEIARSHAAIFEALASQAEALRVRAGQAREAEQQRFEQLNASIAGSELAPVLIEYEQFRTQVEPTLAALPESYRSVMLAHHASVAERLRQHVADLVAEPIALTDAPALELDVVFSLDAAEDEPDLLVCVVPVPAETLSDWAERPEDLLTAFAARVMQALYAACAERGLNDVVAIAGGHLGVLAVEAEIGGPHGEIEAALGQAITRVVSSAPELRAANVVARPRRVQADFLLPPEGAPEGDDDAS